MNSASLNVFEVPTGPAGLDVVRDRLQVALSGGGPIAPLAAGQSIPAMVGAAVSSEISAVVATSGSTGNPRGVLLSQEAITHAADALMRRAGGPAAWLVAMPVNHVGGLMVVARAVLSGTPTYALSSLGGAQPFTAEAFEAEGAKALAAAGAEGLGLRVSLVPTQLRRVLESPRALDLLCRFDGVLSGAAATPDDMADRLRGAGVRLLVSYGMSETAGGCVYDGLPLDGVGISLDADSRVVIEGPCVAHGYLGDPKLTAASFSFEGGARRHLSNDVGAWVDGRLVITGRTDDIVKVGGVAVSLVAVAEAIRALPGISDAIVLVRPDPEWGSVPVAFVVRDGGRSSDHVDDARLRAAVGDRLGRAAVPRAVLTLPAIPLLPNGKADRQSLLAALFADEDIRPG